jgi:pimeloyl-ACP methyl ester carboxylesterase
MFKIHALVEGNGPTVILAHGWAASHTDWQGQIPALVNAGYRVYALDHLGHGASEKPATANAYTLANVYAAFCAWVNSLQLTQPFALVGHSMGGYISLQYAAEYPEQVRSLALVDPLYTRAQMSILLSVLFSQPRLLSQGVRIIPVQVIAALYRLLPQHRMRQDICSEIAQNYKKASPLIAYILYQVPSLQGHLHRVTAPSLLMYGEQDLSLKPAAFPSLASQLPNLVAQRGFARIGHTPHINCPEEVNDELLAFLR